MWGCSPWGCELLVAVARVATAMQGISCWHGRADRTGDDSNVSFYRNSLAALVHPSTGSSQPRSSACSQSACKQTCSVPRWDSSRDEKERLAKIKKTRIFCSSRHTQQCQAGPSAQRCTASAGLVLSAAAQMAKGRPCLSVKVWKLLEGRRHSAGHDAKGSNGAWPYYDETQTGASNRHQKETQLTASLNTPDSCLSESDLTSPAIPSASTTLSGTGTVLRVA